MKWWQWIGPWPLRPLAIGLLTTVFAVATTSYSLTLATAPRNIGAAIAAGACGGGVLWLARRLALRAVTTLAGYLAAVALAALAGNVVRLLTDTMLNFPNFSPLANVVATWARSILFVLIFLALLGASQRRLQAQVDRADDAVEALQKQAEALLAADEEVRRQVALVLHDRVQAGLIAACLRLRKGLRSDPPDSQEISDVLDQLEELRTLDVRHAVYALSPNLREVDLLTSLEELGRTYDPAMTAAFDVNVDVPNPLRLGVYRIVEQCLLNAAMHGGAQTTRVTIHEGAAGLTVTVADDGAGLPAVVAPGFGTTLIDTWCRVLGATWERQSRSGGVTVVVRIPDSSHM